MTLIERPHQYCWSKNDIRYQWQLSNLTRAGLQLQVRIKYQSIGGAEKELYTLLLTPLSNGMVTAYINAYIDSLLVYVMPTLNNYTTNANAQLVYFWVEYREVTDAIADGSWTTTESNKKRLAVKGGIEQQRHMHNNYFLNVWEVSKPFLTWQPNNLFYFANSRIYLTIFNPTNATLTVKLSGYFESLSVPEEETIALPSGALLVHLQYELPTMRNAQPNLTFVRITAQVFEGTTAVSSLRSMMIEHRPNYAWYELVFHNSLSGIDSVVVRGDVNEVFERNAEESEGGKTTNWLAETQSHNQYAYFITQQRVFKGDAGYQRSKAAQEALMDLMMSKSIYQRIESKWVPVVGLAKTIDLGVRMDATPSFPIEWKLSEVNEVYTPSTITLGEGQDVETY